MMESLDIRYDVPWAKGRAVAWYEELSSTQDTLRSWCQVGAPHGATVVARRQTRGRGRQGRTWQDTSDGNLYASVLLTQCGKVENVAAFALVAGLAVRSTCVSWLDLGLKWPNDLWIDGRKVGGLLLESPAAENTQVLVGLGLNLRRPRAGWKDLEGRAVSFEECGVDLAPVEFLSGWLVELDRRWHRFVQEGFRPDWAEWEQSSILTQREIEWEKDGARYRGRVVGVNEAGGLRVRGSQGQVDVIHAGEVHLLGAAK